MLGQRLTEGGHGLVLDRRLAVAGGQVGAGVVAALVVVVFDVEAGQLGVANSQRAAGVIDVLPIEGLGEEFMRETTTENPLIYRELQIHHANETIGNHRHLST